MRKTLALFVIVMVFSEISCETDLVTEAPILRSTTHDERYCIWACPKTVEYNPICGSDGVRYYNIGYLTCAQECGIIVRPLHPPPCTGLTSTTIIPQPPSSGFTDLPPVTGSG